MQDSGTNNKPLYRFLNSLPERYAFLKFFADNATAKLLFHVGAILILYLLFDKLAQRAMALSFQDYQQFTIIAGLLSSLGAPIVTAGALVAIALFFTANLAAPWQAMEEGQSFRYFTCFLAALMAWPLLTYGYNHYYGQAHLIDRALLLVLLIATFWRPVFVIPFVLLAYAILAQFAEPQLGGSVLAHKTQVLKAVQLSGAAFSFFALTGCRDTRPVLFIVCCYVAAGYWLPAIAKLELGWVADNRLDLMPLSAYAHGWLAGFSSSDVAAAFNQLSFLNAPMRVFVIVLEAAFLIFLWKRGLSILLLAGAIMFHLAVFALLGFFFWTWIALDLALIVWLVHWHRQRHHVGSSVEFRGLPLFFSMILIGFGAYWAKPPALGWFETPLIYSYQYEATLSDGSTTPLHPKYFSPYEDVFTMASFFYLPQQHATLVGPYGVTHDKNVRNSLLQATTPADVFLLEEGRAPNHNEARSANLKQFLARFIAHRNSHPENGRGWYRFHSPLQFWSQRTGLTHIEDLTVSHLKVIERTYFYDGTSLAVIREQEVLGVDIAATDVQ